ncbi:hypothetical protein M231_03019 [Tremella mesenterica]|uniref:Non-structural maintenance of chromosomes element 1 homolog n=1 Tax=Tremella mesenterica TaxID=5217 RepID=A0A4Q1BP44_TREME|nr:uncharacterized protein TREMEDRAFT_74710 [Tremella mesenterica DSM 1558]EIW66484.1 hypothetical protein TREMEDRAFT_74710 [Tremella mesenterica DSM 1558]RXK39665.1 hypothetical protein M231_03019 [Tremella mesenterica]
MSYTEPTDLHRVYIQCLLSRRAMTEDVALEMYKRAISACQALNADFHPAHPRTAAGFKSFLDEIGHMLEEVGMNVREGREEIGKGRQWIVLCNTDPSDVALSATDLTPLEITFYREMIAEIMESYPANSIGHNRAIALVNRLDGSLTRSAAEAVLRALVSRGWLAKSNRGRYSLAPRAMLELENYLRGEYDGLHNCGRCKKLMLTGVACTNPKCNTHIHGFCHEALLRTRPQCPACKIPFAEQAPRPIGEASVRREEDGYVRDVKNKRKRVPRAEGDVGHSGSESEHSSPQQPESPQHDETQTQTQTQQELSESREGTEEVSTESQIPSGRKRKEPRKSGTWATQSPAGKGRMSRVPETQYDEDV